jgi:heme-degrading monooxygenase HmoA
MIARHWRGLARRENAAAYQNHLHDETFPALKRLPGFRGGSILQREAGGGIEFLVVTEWDSLDAIRAFAGEDIETAVVPANVQAMMIEYDARVRHYAIVERQ